MEAKRPRGRPVSAVKSHKRSMTFPPSLYARLEEIALREERNVNELIVSVLRDRIRKDEQSPGNSAAAPASA